MLAILTASFSFSARGVFWWTLAAGAVLVALIVTGLGYRRQSASILSPRMRWLCFGLKVVALGLLALVLLEPVQTGRQAKPGANDFLLLVDNGEGMQLQGGEALRQDLVDAAADENSWLGLLESRFRVDAFAVDQRLRKLRHYADLDLEGYRSDLAGALEAVEQRYARRPLAGVLLFSDGNATDRARFEGLALTRPIFPVLVEDPGREVRDLGLTDFAVSSTAFEDAPVTVSVSVRAVGLKGERCRVRILDEAGEEVAAESRRIDAAEEDLALRLRFRASHAGVAAYRVTVELESGDGRETTMRNNQRDWVIDRGRGDYRILYIGGRPNWEYKFLRRALQRDDEIEMVGLIRVAKREPKFEWRGRAGETSNPLFRGFQNQLPVGEETYDKPVLIRLNTVDATELRDGFPKEREPLFSQYDALILDDVEAAFFTPDQQELIEKFVSIRGGALLMLGGQESLQWGGYDRTPIARILPVYLERLARAQTAVAPAGSLNLTREGWLEPWVRLRLTGEEEEIRLAHMPPFTALNRLNAVKPGASLLATVTDAAGVSSPALAVHSFGEGRAGALMIGDIWRWGMEDAGLREDMEKWWRQVGRWLVADVPDFIEVHSAWDGEPGGATRRLEVRVKNPGFRPEENATVQLRVSRLGVSEVDAEAGETGPVTLFAEPSLEEAGLFTASFPCLEPGVFRVEAVVENAEGEELGTVPAGWAWNPAAAEFASLDPDEAALRELAEKSGGHLVKREELPAFVRDLAKREAPVTEVWSRPAWHHPGWFLLVMLLFLAEWGLRRWKGLA